MFIFIFFDRLHSAEKYGRRENCDLLTIISVTPLQHT